MRSPARAIAWEFGQPHRWALIGLAGYMLVLGILKPLLLGSAPTRLDPPNSVASLAIVPFSVTFMYFLAVFSFGLSGDLAARHSIYPARMFTLPVTTTALAGWPMLYGTAAMAILWLTTALLARWPWGIDVPLVWPALLAAAFLAWTQALMWMPYGVPGLRVIVAVLWLASLDAVVLLAIHYEARESAMVAFLAPQLPLAYLAARYAVARARRGDVPDWRSTFARILEAADVLPRRRRRFASAAGAQAWLEWRRHGRALPAMVGMVLPFELGLLFIPGNDTPAVILTTLFWVLLTPLVMAGFAAATVNKSNQPGSNSCGVTPFIAARPLTSAALIAAKLKMAMWSTIAAWLLVAVATTSALSLSGAGPVVVERINQGLDDVGTPRAIVILIVGSLGLLITTWHQLVQSLYIGLTGREWIIKTSGLLAMVLLIAGWPVAEWIHDDSAVQAALWDAWPWILTVLVGLKMSAAAWIATRLYRRRLVDDRALVIGAACWLAAVLALYGLLVWFFATPFIPRSVLVLVAILAIPLARLSAAPLALAWNRHR